jgi:hypothetical protein
LSNSVPSIHQYRQQGNPMSEMALSYQAKLPSISQG